MANKELFPLVSIITPSFNQAEFLEDCIRSVLDQDYPNIEYIIVDGGSRDGSQAIIKRFGKQITWWVSEPDGGQAEAINKGYSKAKGEIVAWLNSDDLYRPSAISEAVEFLEKHPKTAMVYGDLDSIKRDGQRFHTIKYQQFDVIDLLAFRMIGQPSVFMRRKMMPKERLLDPNFHYLLDHHLWLRIAIDHPIQHVPRIWAAARHHSGAKNRAQASHFGEEAFRIVSWAEKQDKFRDLFDGNRRKIYAGAHRLKARYLLAADQAFNALKSYSRAFLNNPNELIRHWRALALAKLTWLGLAWLRPAPYESDRPILVTGIHRSGTSWLGRMLNLSGRGAYISEPFNVLHRRGVMDVKVEHWYTYITKDNAGPHKKAYSRMLDLRYGLGKEIPSLRSGRDLLRMIRDAFVFARGRLAQQRPLIKDPFAIFSIPWLIQEFDCQVVIIIRHPAAAVSSLKRLGWHFNLHDLLAQDQLMQDWLEPFREEIENLADQKKDVIGQGALLWRMIYYVAHELKQIYPGIQMVRHEDLSRNPLKVFENIYAELELPFNQKAQQGIMKASQSKNPSEVSIKSIYSTKLNSRANLGNWRKRLTNAEIERIKELTKDVSAHYYKDEDWD